MTKRILITGGNGLVGKAIASVLPAWKQEQSSNDIQVTFLTHEECDLERYEETLTTFQRIQPTHIIHLAANVGGLFKNMSQPVQMLERNLLLNLNVLRCAHEVHVTFLLCCLSTCIFPDPVSSYPITSEHLHDGPPHPSNFTYAYAKRIMEIHCQAYRQQYGDHFVCIIPTNLYGEHDNFHLQDGHVIPSLIHKCYLAKEHQQPFVVSGTGTPLRQFLYAPDFARILLWCLDHYPVNQTSRLLIAPPCEEVSIRQVAEWIAHAFSYDAHLVMDPSQPDGQYKKTVDYSHVTQFLPEMTFTPLEEGIHTTVQWFLTHSNTCRK